MTARAELQDASGRPVLTYERRDLAGRPIADFTELAAGITPADALVAVREHLAGWVLGGDGPLLDAAVDAGFVVRRHAHTYSWDLVAHPPPAAWADLTPSTGLRVGPAPDRTAADLVDAARLAYPPGHPDGVTDHLGDIDDVLAGRVVGPLLLVSEVVEADGAVVAALLVNQAPAPPPFGGPWVSEVFRDPAPRYAGLGTLLLRRGLAHLAAAGAGSLGLAVTDGNPARRTYERLGFGLTSSGRTVFVPD